MVKEWPFRAAGAAQRRLRGLIQKFSTSLSTVVVENAAAMPQARAFR